AWERSARAPARTARPGTESTRLPEWCARLCGSDRWQLYSSLNPSPRGVCLGSAAASVRSLAALASSRVHQELERGSRRHSRQRSGERHGSSRSWCYCALKLRVHRSAPPTRSVCTLALDRPERSVRRVQQPNVRTALSKMVALPWYAWQPPCQALSFPWETRHDT